MNVDLEILRANINKLVFVKGVSIYFDSSATQRHVFNQNQKIWEHNFSLVSEKGDFLTGFHHDVEVTEHGLFRLRDKCNYHYPPHDFYYTVWFMDFSGNNLSETNFEILMAILGNRNESAKNDFVEITNELESSVFSIIENGAWTIKKGNKQIIWWEERSDDLIFVFEEENRTHSDSTYDWEYVIDKSDNKMLLNDFYTGCKMLNNGAEYLKNINRIK